MLPGTMLPGLYWIGKECCISNFHGSFYLLFNSSSYVLYSSVQSNCSLVQIKSFVSRWVACWLSVARSAVVLHSKWTSHTQRGLRVKRCGFLMCLLIEQFISLDHCHISGQERQKGIRCQANRKSCLSQRHQHGNCFFLISTLDEKK